MKQECIDTLSRAAGRILTIAERRNIEKRILDARQELYNRDPDVFSAMTQGEKLQESGKIAAENLKIEAAKRQQQIASTILAHDQISKFREKGTALGYTNLETVRHLIGSGESTPGLPTTDTLRSRIRSNQLNFQGTSAAAFRTVGRKYFNMFSNKLGDQAFRYEVAGRDSKEIEGVTPEMAAAAKESAAAWSNTAESMRVLRNKLGGSIGKLEGYVPQDHSMLRVAKAGAEKWGDFITPLLDRRTYLNDAGETMNDAEINQLFKGNLEDGIYKDGIHSTISTGGADDLDAAGKFKGNKMMANRSAESRVIRFKDVESQTAYDNEYGGGPLYDKLIGHIDHMSMEIGALESFGANPDLMAKYQIDDALTRDNLADNTRSAQNKADADQLRAFYNYTVGKGSPIVNHTIARIAENTRDIIAGTKLPLAPPALITHLSSVFMAAHYNQLPVMQLLRNMGHVFNPLDRPFFKGDSAEERQAQRLKLSLETALGNTNKWAGDKLKVSTFIKYASNASIRLSGLHALVEGFRRAFGVTMYGSIGSMVGKLDSLDKVSGWSKMLLDNKGVTPEDWQVWRATNQEDWGGGNKSMIVPENIFQVPDEKIAHLGNPSTLRQNAAMRLIGMADEESHRAVVSTGNWARFQAAKGEKGNPYDEIAGSVRMFKSIVTAQFAQNFNRGMTLPNSASRAAYGAGYLAYAALFAGLTVQVQELLAGRDPENMSTAKFWAAVATKGTLGMYGDLLLNQNASRDGLERYLGPLYSQGNDLYKMTVGNGWNAVQGKKTNFASSATRFAYGLAPKPFYFKAFLDRNIHNNIQEAINPQYMQRVQQRARAAKATYFYPQDQLLPNRAPNFSKAIGQP